MAANPMIKRSCRLYRTLRIAEPVAYSIDGVYVLFVPGGRLKFAPQAVDVGVHGPIESLKIVAKDPINDLVPGKSPAWFPNKQSQQANLSRREVDLGFADMYSTPPHVHGD